jgi:hypothetical protein
VPSGLLFAETRWLHRCTGSSEFRPALFFLLFFWCFTMGPGLASKSRSSCFSLLSAGIRGTYHHARHALCFLSKYWGHHLWVCRPQQCHPNLSRLLYVDSLASLWSVLAPVIFRGWRVLIWQFHQASLGKHVVCWNFLGLGHHFH